MTAVTNQAAANSIANLLAEGRIRHPGDPDKKQPEVTLALPMFAVRGRDPNMTQSMHDNLKVMAEAIIHHIEHDLALTLIPTAELEQLRAQTNGAA